MDGLKKIMLSSFNDSFFVVKRNDTSEKYLKLLTDMVIAGFNLDRNNYIEIANRICEYDSRIKTSYSKWDVFITIPLLKYSDRFVDIYNKWACSFRFDVSDLLLRRMQRIIADKKKMFPATIIYIVVQNYSCLSATDKENVLSLIESIIDEHIAMNLIRPNGLYNTIETDDDIYQDLLTQIIIYKYCELKGYVFNYQTPHSIKVFEYLDKENMYFDIRESIHTSFSELSTDRSDEYGVVLSKLIGHNITFFTGKVNDYGMLDYYYEWITSDKIKSYSLMKAFFEIQKVENDIYDDLFAMFKELSFLKKENDKLRAEIDDLNISREKQEHELMRVIHQNENNHKELMKQIDISNNEKNELHALRELLFTLKSDTLEEPELLNVNDSNINYDEIVIIGGHIKWTQKLKEQLPGINVVSADQKCVDVKFVRKKKFVLFFINYLSHSLYLQVISKLHSEQKIGFIKKRNIADVIEEIRNIYLQ